MALVRCSRGGKTRALKEVAHQLHRKLPGTAIIFVSFNDLTPVQPWEQADPLGALCRRIAFAARRRPDPTQPLSPKDEMDQFKAFNYAVTPDQIEQWVANTPCILAIDELNLFHRLQENSFEAGVTFAVFLGVGIGGQAAALSLTQWSLSVRLSGASPADVYLLVARGVAARATDALHGEQEQPRCSGAHAAACDKVGCCTPC